MTNRDLLQAVFDHPDDDAARLVYADWLEERGDARGAFIRAQVAEASVSEDTDEYWLATLQSKLLAGRHGKHWAGPLRHLVKRWEFRRGFVEKVAIDAAEFLRHPDVLFQHGPIRALRLRNVANLVPDLARCKELAQLIELDLRHESGLSPDILRPLLDSRYVTNLRTLILRGTGVCSGPGIQMIARCASLARLTTLDLGTYRRDAVMSLRQVSRERGWQAAQSWGARTAGNGIDENSMRALVESKHLQQVKSLALDGHGGALQLEAFGCLLQSRFLSRLEALDLSSNYPWTGLNRSYDEGDNMLSRLAQSPAADNLRVLSLRLSPLGEPLLPDSHLRNLRCLQLEDAFPSREWIDGLARGAFPEMRRLHVLGTFFDWNSDDGGALAEALVSGRGLPHLALLDLRQSIVGRRAVKALVAGSLARLRWLSLARRSCSYKREGYDAIDGATLKLLLHAPNAGKLLHLNVSNHDLTDDDAKIIAVSPLRDRLVSLNVWHNQIGAPGCAALAGMPSLSLLDLRANPISANVKAKLRDRFGSGVRFGAGKKLSGDRSQG